MFGNSNPRWDYSHCHLFGNKPIWSACDSFLFSLVSKSTASRELSIQQWKLYTYCGVQAFLEPILRTYSHLLRTLESWWRTLLCKWSKLMRWQHFDLFSLSPLDTYCITYSACPERPKQGAIPEVSIDGRSYPKCNIRGPTGQLQVFQHGSSDSECAWDFRQGFDLFASREFWWWRFCGIAFFWKRHTDECCKCYVSGVVYCRRNLVNINSCNRLWKKIVNSKKIGTICIGVIKLDRRSLSPRA